MKPMNKTATDLFELLRARFSPVTLGNESAEVTSDPNDARFFSFVYKENEKPLGTVSISIIDNRSLKVYYNHDMVESIVATRDWYDTLKQIRFFAKQNLMSFDARDIQKDQLDTRDYDFIKVNDGPYKEDEVEITESKMYGSKRKSKQQFENATLVVYHKKTVDEEVRGSRSRHIDKLFIESNGEKFRFPVNYLNGARAMAVHVSEGGTPYDDIGKHIISTVEEMRNLSQFARITRKHAMEDEEASGIRSRVVEAYQSIRKDIMRMQNVNNYRNFVETFEPKDTTANSDVNHLQEKFTVKVWNEKMDDLLPSVQRALENTNEDEASMDDDDSDTDPRAFVLNAVEVAKDIQKDNYYFSDSSYYEFTDGFDTDDDDFMDHDLVQQVMRALPNVDMDEDEIKQAVDALAAMDTSDIVDEASMGAPDYNPAAGQYSSNMEYGMFTPAGNEEVEEIVQAACDMVKTGEHDVMSATDAAMNMLTDLAEMGSHEEAEDTEVRENVAREIQSRCDSMNEEELDEASPSVEKTIKDPNFVLVLKKDDAADGMIMRTKFNNAGGLLAFVMGDIATRIIGNNSDAIANFASDMMINVGEEGESFGTRMTPEYKRDRALAMMLAKKYIDDIKRMATDTDYSNEVRKDPSEVYGAKKKRSGGYHEAIDTFESWVNDLVEATTTGTVGTSGTVPAARPNQQVLKALAGGDPAATQQVKRIGDKLAKGQKLTPAEMPVAGEIAKKLMTTKKTSAAMQALANSETNTPEDGEVAILEKTLKVKAEKDYDSDGRIESPRDEYMGSRDNAIRKNRKKQPTAEEINDSEDESLFQESLNLIKTYAGI